MELLTPKAMASLIEHIVHIVKGMSFSNVLTLAMLVVVLAPTYLLWRVLNDTAMLGRILSSYEEVSSDKVDCTLRIASQRGAGATYSISTGFAYQGNDRWIISVVMDRNPTESELQSYCATLNLIIDFMRDPTARSPVFPGTKEPMVNMYPE